MKNSTSIKIANKYMNQLELVEQDGDGYWAYSNPGFMFEEMGCHTAHEDTQKELQAVIRTLVPCDCEQCQKDLAPAVVADYDAEPIVIIDDLKNGKINHVVIMGDLKLGRTSAHRYQALSITFLKDDELERGFRVYSTFSKTMANAEKAASRDKNEIIKNCEPGTFIKTVLVDLTK